MEAINSVNTNIRQCRVSVFFFHTVVLCRMSSSGSCVTASAMAQRVKAKPDLSFNLQNPCGRKNRTHAHKLFSGLCACIKIIKF